jgi:hypothetical protein
LEDVPTIISEFDANCGSFEKEKNRLKLISKVEM